MQNFKKQLSSAQDQLAETGKKMQKVGTKMTALITAPIIGIGVASFNMASDLEDALGATDQIFKKSAGEMKTWAKNLESYYGIAEGEALEYANTMGAMLQNIGGLTEKEASKQSQTLLELAGDMAAMFGGTTESAVNALTGALKGNNTMLDNYGMGVTQATIQSEALRMGLIKGKEEMSMQAKQAATLSIIMKQTGDVQGQAGREAEGAAGTMRALTTELKNLGSEIGTILLPMIIPILQGLKDMAVKFSELSPATKELVVKIALLAAAIGPLLLVFGTVLAMIPQMVAGFGMLKGAMLAVKAASMSAMVGPLGLVVAAIAAVIAIGVLLYKNWDKIKETAITVGKAVSEAFTASIDFVKGIFTGFIDFIKERIQAMKDAFMIYIDFLKNIFTGDFEAAFQNIKDFLSKFVSEAFAEFVQKCYDFGKNIVSSIADGIKSKINDVKDAISDVTSKVRDYLPFSPAKEGPLKDLNKLNFGGTISDGIYSGMGQIQTAMNTALNVPNVSGTGGKTANITIDLDGRTIAQSMGTHLVDNIRVGTGSRI